MSQRGMRVRWGACIFALYGVACAGHDGGLEPDDVAQAQSVATTGAATPAAIATGAARAGRHGHGHGHSPASGAADAGSGEVADAANVDADAPSASLRIASMGSDFPPFDVCLGNPSTSDGGDASRLLAANGLPEGVAATQVSGYVPVAPGAYLARFVRAGAADCSQPLDPVAAPVLTTIEAGSHLTLLVRGSLGHLFVNVIALTDDVPAAGALVRLVGTTIPSPGIGVGVGTGESFVPWISRVSVSSVQSNVVGSPPETDVNGYAHVAPVTGATLTVRVGVGTEFMHVPGFDLAEGDVVTLFAQNLPLSNFRLIACRDFAEPTSPLTSCTTFAE